ncbi:hypothetical protein [Streptomyces phaeochromogenes]
MQAYLAAYAAEFGLEPVLRLSTEVTAARPAGHGRWTLETRDAGGVESVESFDRLGVADGVFCEPLVPAYPGLEEFTAAGGRLRAATERAATWARLHRPDTGGQLLRKRRSAQRPALTALFQGHVKHHRRGPPRPS